MEEILLSFINLDDFCVSNFKNSYKDIVSIINSKKNNYNIWKTVIICYSMHDYSINNEIFNYMVENRIDDDIVFGPKISNDLYSDRIIYSKNPIYDGINIRNSRIIKEKYNHYNKILNVPCILIFDNELNVSDEKLFEILDHKTFYVYKNKELKKLVKTFN